MGTDHLKRPAVQVFVATTVMLAFISYWRAAAVVLSDLASSAFYAPGIAEAAIGKSAAWFILAVMLFSYGVRALYIESSTMFVRGGVYRVVKSAMGSTLAKIAVSALMFDFLLTGPISAVAAGQYVAGFVQNFTARIGHPWNVRPDAFSVFFALAVTAYFWWKNVQGIHESSEKALRIMQITTVMVVLLILWSVYTLFHVGFHLPPSPLPVSHMVFTKISLGWLLHTGVSSIAVLALLIGFGHSVLAMSGEETLAQVYREIEHPKVRNLEKTAAIIFVYTLIFTTLAAFFGEMIVPDAVRQQHLLGNLLGVLAMYLYGPYNLRLAFQAFVVVVGALILAGAVNTAIIGSNGVLNRVSEDGVLHQWFRAPHKKYGTSYRIINMICILQVVIIVITRGNVELLGEGYAFGLIWSFTFLAVSVLVLRFTAPEGREWRIPLNFHIGRTEVPLGAAMIAIVLLATAVMNLFTKEIATIAGASFTLAFFVLFVVSERVSRRKQRRAGAAEMDQFQVTVRPDVEARALRVRPGNILVAVRDPNALFHLRYILDRVDTTRQDVVVMTARLYRGPFVAPVVADETHVFDDYEQDLFTRVVGVAEKAGKTVSLLVVPGTDVFQSIVMTAQRIESSTIIAGVSRHLSAEEQGKQTGDAWEHLAEPRPRLTLEIAGPDGLASIFHLGPHTPRLRAEDLELLHNIWLELTTEPEFRGLHHYDVIALALKELQMELHGGGGREALLRELEALARQPRYESKRED
ncbi:MAG: APC family permease [Terriglobales bacterium]